MDSQTKASSGSQQKPSDLAHLWREAFIAYNETVGEKGQKLQIDGIGLVMNLTAVLDSVDKSKKSFEQWRNKGGSLEKARHFIGKNLGYAQKIGDQLIGSATVAFPPAGAIWTVATYAIKACQDMSRDYNQLLTLIGETGTFLKTLQIIEERFPDCPRYAECVTEAFTAILMVFAIQTQYMYDKRALKFLHSLTSGADEKLSGAYGDVTAAITRLSLANGFMVVKTTEDIKKLMGEFGEKIDFVYEEMTLHFEQQSQAIQDAVDIVGVVKGGVSNVAETTKKILSSMISHRHPA
jgi:methyl-accepting chemotaxis protein